MICQKCLIDKNVNSFGVKLNNKTQSYCKECQRAYQKIWYSKNRKHKINQSIKNKQKHYNWYRQFKQKLKCELCDENHPACLEFHHKDRKEKLFNISSAVSDYGKNKLLSEISKCQILCSNCHKKLHHNASVDK